MITCLLHLHVELQELKLMSALGLMDILRKQTRFLICMSDVGRLIWVAFRSALTMAVWATMVTKMSMQYSPCEGSTLGLFKLAEGCRACGIRV